jgi:hypothetical protein
MKGPQFFLSFPDFPLRQVDCMFFMSCNLVLLFIYDYTSSFYLIGSSVYSYYVHTSSIMLPFTLIPFPFHLQERWISIWQGGYSWILYHQEKWSLQKVERIWKAEKERWCELNLVLCIGYWKWYPFYMYLYLLGFWQMEKVIPSSNSLSEIPTDVILVHF